MNFSECFKQTGQLCKFSPNQKALANAAQYRLVIRDVKSLQIKALFTCLDNINHIEWSADSMFLLCAMYKRGIIQVWSLENTEWTCKIDHGSLGLVYARWSPDSRHILSTSDFKLRITVWSLINKAVSYIKFPKHSQKGLEFSKNGKYMAVAERRNHKDFISIFACDTWEMLKHFATDTKDLSDISFSPNGNMIAAWDSKLEYKVVIYSLDGRFISSYSAYDYALGVKSVTWSPTNQFLAVGSYDQQVRLLNNVTWKSICEFQHPPKITNPHTTIYLEIEKKNVLLPWETEPGTSRSQPSHYAVQDKPYQLPSIRPDAEKPNPKLGVGSVSFSYNSHYMATKNDNMPNVLWVWDLRSLKLVSLLVQCHAIKAFSWDPKEIRLALCAGTNKLYMWSLAGCLAVEVPGEGDIAVTSLTWHESGDSILLASKDQMCMCFLTNPEDSM
ncbi:WD repeat-containing protein WRAP73-like [Clytia hemisphaerica]|uniref:WD repeat-containing protein WRAP73 n=1 Tax=Clytia hemisphaerica TaxID=252671 RepID=A0A7M6DN76_9CNID